MKYRSRSATAGTVAFLFLSIRCGGRRIGLNALNAALVLLAILAANVDFLSSHSIIDSLARRERAAVVKLIGHSNTLQFIELLMAGSRIHVPTNGNGSGIVLRAPARDRPRLIEIRCLVRTDRDGAYEQHEEYKQHDAAHYRRF
jgi:hypothetical protein